MGKILTNNATYNSMIARCVGSESELKEAFGLMIDSRMAPINLNGNYMRYSSKTIINSNGYNQMIKQKGIIEQIIPLSEVDPEVIDQFIRDNPFQQFFINSDRINRNATMFFIHTGVVAAVMYVCTYENNDVFGPTCYIHPQSKYEFAIPFLVVAMIERAQELLGEINDVILCPSYAVGKAGLEKLFGTPEYEIPVQDYSIIYRDLDDGEKIKERIATYNESSVKEDILFDYFDKEEFTWVSAAATLRIPYVVDLRKLPESILKPYRTEVMEWIKKWDLDKAIWKDIVFRCGKTKGTINSVLMEDLQNQRCKDIYATFLTKGVIPEFDAIELKKDDITIRLFDNDRDEWYDFMPEHIRKVIHDKEMILLGALTPGNEIIGLAVMDIGGVKEDIAYFKYSYVLKGFENYGIYEKFMEFSINIAKRSGCTCMYSKNMFGKDGNCRYDCEKLAQDYVDIHEKDESVILVYRLEQLIDVDMHTRQDDHKEIKIVTASDVSEYQLKILQKRAWEEQGVYYDPENFDENYTYFVDDYTTLNAAVFATQLSESELILRDIYISSIYRKGDVSVDLVTEVLKKARINMDLNAFILLKTDKTSNVKIIEDVFGKAKEKLYEKEIFGDLDESDSDEELQKLYMPNDISIERAFCEKLRTMVALYGGMQSVEILCSLLLDRCSDYPGNKICRYIRDNYM